MENEDLSFGTYGKFGTSGTSHTNGTHSWANLNACNFNMIKHEDVKYGKCSQLVFFYFNG